MLCSAGTGVHLVESQGLELIAEGCLPAGLALDLSGALLFADALDHCVVRCAWRGGASRQLVAGAKPQGPQTSGQDLARLHRPFGVCVDLDGSLLVVDSGNHRVVRWKVGATKGQLLCGGQRGCSLSQLSYPRGMALEPSGALLICDTFNHRLLRWRRGASKAEVLFGGTRGRQLDQLNRPTAVVCDAARRRILVADSGNHRVLTIPWRLGGIGPEIGPNTP